MFSFQPTASTATQPTGTPSFTLPGSAPSNQPFSSSSLLLPQVISQTHSTNHPLPPETFSSHPFRFIAQCYDPASSNYKFRIFFYNPISDDIKGSDRATVVVQKPSQAVTDGEWERVKANNPDSSRFVPVMACGFNSLKERREWQQSQSKAQLDKLQELEIRLGAVKKQLSEDQRILLEDVQARQQRLLMRSLRILRIMHALRNVDHTTKFQEILLKPIAERVRYIDTRIKILTQQQVNTKDVKENEASCATVNLNVLQSNSAKESLGLNVIEQGSFESLLSLLQVQQHELARLVEELQKERKTVDTIKETYLKAIVGREFY